MTYTRTQLSTVAIIVHVFLSAETKTLRLNILAVGLRTPANSVEVPVNTVYIGRSHLNVVGAIYHGGVLLGETDRPELQRCEDGCRGVDVISVDGAGVEESGGEEPAGLDRQRGEFMHPSDHVPDGVDVWNIRLFVHHWNIASVGTQVYRDLLNCHKLFLVFFF